MYPSRNQNRHYACEITFHLLILVMYKIWGKVRIGNQRGKKLGFPTANITLRKNIPEGIYISKTKIKNKIHPSLTFIGRAITFNEKELKAETYLLSLGKNLYSTWISVHLLKKIRENIKFRSANDLIKQMEKDKKDTLEYFRRNV